MSALDSLEKYFFGGEAEAESEIRNAVFVEPQKLRTLLNFNRSRYKILLGQKGVGKTILLSVMHDSVLENDEIALLITPKDINCEEIYKKQTVSDRISAAYNQLVLSIGAKIGSCIDRIGISDSTVNLQKLAVDQGLKRPDAISRFSEFLTAITPKGKDIARAAREIQKIDKKPKTIKADINKTLQYSHQHMWLLIDDIDQASVDSSEKFDYAVCWALIAAAIDLANDFTNIRCIISVRTDVWHTITAVKKLGSDRLDKIQKPFHLSFDEKEIENIFFKRIELANRELGHQNSRSILEFFAETNVELPGVQEIKRYWSQWLAKTSRNKPRDLVHLIQKLIDKCNECNDAKITDKHAHAIMLEFAKERIDNIGREFAQICPQTKAIIKGVASKTKFEFHEIIELLSKLPSSMSIQINGQTLQPNQNLSALEILKLLYYANFINARIELNKEGSEYDHITFDKNRELITIEAWNELQKYKWEVHPTFHSYVDSVKRQKKDLIF